MAFGTISPGGGGGDGADVIVENSGDYTVTANDDCVANTGPSIVTLLPTASATKKVKIKSVSPGGVITLTPDGIETIDGAATQMITAGASLTVFPVAAGWLIA